MFSADRKAGEIFRRLAEARTMAPRPAYCAFLDLLGISAKSEDFETVRNVVLDAFEWLFPGPVIWGDLMRESGLATVTPRAPQGMLLGDAVVVTGPALGDLLDWVSVGVGGSLVRGVPVRGCIAFGQHLQLTVAENQLVLGDALVKAYEGESRALAGPTRTASSAAGSGCPCSRRTKRAVPLARDEWSRRRTVQH